jgi:adenine phosphoribosyltransferase
MLKYIKYTTFMYWWRMDLKEKIRSIPDFPKKGIMFRDITTLIKDPAAFQFTIDRFVDYYKEKSIDVIVGIESRGFIFGAALAYAMGVEFAIVRKPGKLPGQIISEEYELEYGTDRIEMHKDAILPGQHVVIVDDLLATGGTVLAASKLVEKTGAVIDGLAFVIELVPLKGREKIKNYDVLSLVKYDSEE